MKDNIQNIADLIGALAEDIEEIKKKLDAKEVSDKDEAVKRLAVKLEPVIRFFSGNTPKLVCTYLLLLARDIVDISNPERSATSLSIIGFKVLSSPVRKKSR